MAQPPIMLYSFPTPNGIPVTIHMEELKAAYPGFNYDLKIMGLRNNEQKEDWYIKLNPNGRIPTIVDRTRGNFSVFETSAIMLYMSQHYDPEFKFWFDPNNDPENYSKMLQWIFFAHGGIGPMQGQAEHFVSHATEDVPYAKNRYINECKRLYNVLEIGLKDRDYLAGPGRGKYTLADLKPFTWVRIHAHTKVSENLDEFPNVKAWAKRLEERLGTAAGLKAVGGT